VYLQPIPVESPWGSMARIVALFLRTTSEAVGWFPVLAPRGIHSVTCPNLCVMGLRASTKKARTRLPGDHSERFCWWTSRSTEVESDLGNNITNIITEGSLPVAVGICSPGISQLETFNARHGFCFGGLGNCSLPFGESHDLPSIACQFHSGDSCKLRRRFRSLVGRGAVPKTSGEGL